MGQRRVVVRVKYRGVVWLAEGKSAPQFLQEEMEGLVNVLVALIDAELSGDTLRFCVSTQCFGSTFVTKRAALARNVRAALRESVGGDASFRQRTVTLKL